MVVAPTLAPPSYLGLELQLSAICSLLQRQMSVNNIQSNYSCNFNSHELILSNEPFHQHTTQHCYEWQNNWFSFPQAEPDTVGGDKEFGGRATVGGETEPLVGGSGKLLRKLNIFAYLTANFALQVCALTLKICKSQSAYYVTDSDGGCIPHPLPNMRL